MTTEQLTDHDKLVLCACTAAANVMERNGLTREDIANGMIAYGGAIALELTGPDATADLFRSKADGLDGVVQ